MTEPTTAAGRHFLLLLSQGLPRQEGDAAEAIFRIEAEARASAEARLLRNLDWVKAHAPDQYAGACAVLFMSDEKADEAHMARYRALAETVLAEDTE